MLKHMRLTVFLLTSAFLLGACNSGPESSTSTAVAPQSAGAAIAVLPAGITLLEDYRGRDGDFSVPYTKYRLDNGLIVILHEDHSDPLANVNVAYHVGSSREQPGRSGFAHFFEHMMFEGSAHVPEGALSKIISDAGGSLNGSTNFDSTNYYQDVYYPI